MTLHVLPSFPWDSPSIHILQLRRDKGRLETRGDKSRILVWLPPKCLIHSPTFQFTIKWNWHINLKGKKKRKNDQSHSENSGISKEVTVSWGISNIFWLVNSKTDLYSVGKRDKECLKVELKQRIGLCSL